MDVSTLEHYVRVSLSAQRLELIERGTVTLEYPVSTALKGACEQINSGGTPRGWLVIRARIGAGQPLGTVFVGRRPTGEYYDESLASQHPERDWILTRILWLGGLEPGFNRYGSVDTAKRYIYIHGSPDHGVTGTPASHGCIRMLQHQIITLFDRVSVGTPVRVDV